MKHLFRFLFLLQLTACANNSPKTTISDSSTLTKSNTIKSQLIAENKTNAWGFDTSYSVSIKHNPFMITGYFNNDSIPDTAIIIKHSITQKDALFIKHGGNGESVIIKSGKDIGANFADFNWAEEFSIIKSGTKIWNNVVDGEIISEEEVPESQKIHLKTDAILLHVSEACGGGIIYYSNKKYLWVQQD
jgi:hypothetical protein